MPLTGSTVEAFAGAVVARDFDRVRAMLDPQVDFRAMTPSRIWEADEPAGVVDVLRTWLADPDEDVTSLEAADPPATVEDTVRVGWRVAGADADGSYVFEQQAYVREAGDRIAWLRIMCSGKRRAAD